MERTNLKIRKFTNPAKKFITERYVVENNADLKALLKEFPQLDNNPFNIVTTWKSALKEKRTLLITDESVAGYPTYCFEYKPDNTHPASLIRIIEDDTNTET